MIDIILGAIALGLIWAIATVGTFITFRVLDLADMSMEGTIVLGACVSAMLVQGGANPFLAIAAASLAGGIGGMLTGFLHTRLKIPALLSGILTMTALYSVNIRVMGKTSNVSLLRMDTVLTPLMNAGLSKNIAAIVTVLICVLAVMGFVYWFFGTEIGCAVRATGNNLDMACAQGVNTDATKLIGLVLSNALVGLAGGILAQYLGFADVQMGVGSIVIGLASLIIGEVVFGTKDFSRTLISIVLGAVSYRIIIAFVFEAGMPASDLKLFTAATVAVALCLPQIKTRLDASKTKGGAR